MLEGEIVIRNLVHECLLACSPDSLNVGPCQVSCVEGDEAPSPPLGVQQVGRFTSRWRPRPVSLPPCQPQACRPGRLQGAVGGVGEDPFTGPSSARLADPDIPDLRRLAALAEALARGHASAEQPTLTSQPQGVDGQASAWPHAVKTAAQPRLCPLSVGDLDQSRRSPRVLFYDQTWGLQPPLSPLSRVHGLGSPAAFRHSQLRGVSLPRCRRGKLAMSRWLNTEACRLHCEAPKSVGCSHAVAFLANGGPQRLGPLAAPLCREDLLA